MRIIICDDDENDISSVRSVVEEYFKSKKIKVPQIDCFCSGEALLCDNGPKDIVFLDVEMPGFDGIITGKKLLEKNKNIILIIITSYTEYLDDAMRINVFRYISKPIDSRRLKRNLNDAIGAYNSRKSKPIVIESSDGFVKCNSTDIIMLEVIGRKVSIYTDSGLYITEKPLKEWLNILPNHLFYLCHRSFIVNISRIRKICLDRVIMDKDCLEAYLTKRKYAELKRVWMQYIETVN